MWHFYRNVRQCPMCGSYKTARCVLGNKSSDEHIYKLGLLLGEYIITVPPVIYDHNCMCLICRGKWTDELPLQIISQQEYDRQINLRGIKEARENADEYYSCIHNANIFNEQPGDNHNPLKKIYRKFKSIYIGKED